LETRGYPYTRAHRLLTSDAFKRVFDDPQKVINRRVTLLAKSNGLEHPRLGVVIGKKRVKKAVLRNQLRRQIRDIFRLNQYELAGFDIIILANQRTMGLRPAELRVCLQNLWEELAKLRA
jgi:ribonuclease P protein component